MERGWLRGMWIFTWSKAVQPFIQTMIWSCLMWRWMLPIWMDFGRDWPSWVPNQGRTFRFPILKTITRPWIKWVVTWQHESTRLAQVEFNGGYIDIAKAFNRVEHGLLVHRLNKFVIKLQGTRIQGSDLVRFAFLLSMLFSKSRILPSYEKKWPNLVTDRNW